MKINIGKTVGVAPVAGAVADIGFWPDANAGVSRLSPVANASLTTVAIPVNYALLCIVIRK